MKTKINIEQFDNGITMRRETTDGDADPVAIVVLHRDILEAIGKEVWQDVQCAIETDEANAVEIIIETKAVSK